MMKSEFIELTGFEPTEEEYRDIEYGYMYEDENVDKKTFCNEWVENGGISRICRQRVAKIESLEVANKDLEKRLKKEQEEYSVFSSKAFAEISKMRDEINGLKKEMNILTMQKGDMEMKLKTIKAAFEIIKEV